MIIISLKKIRPLLLLILKNHVTKIPSVPGGKEKKVQVGDIAPQKWGKSRRGAKYGVCLRCTICTGIFSATQPVCLLQQRLHFSSSSSLRPSTPPPSFGDRIFKVILPPPPPSLVWLQQRGGGNGTEEREERKERKGAWNGVWRF